MFKLEVDASAVGAGAVLLQEDTNSIDHPVSYFSRKFNKHQLNYSTIEKEALALLLALQHFEVYLGSSNLPVIVFTDHNPLVFLSRMYNQNQRLMRWALVLQNYNVEIKHKRVFIMFWRMLFRECKDVAKNCFFLQTGLFLRVGVLRPCMVVRSCLSLSLSLSLSLALSRSL